MRGRKGFLMISQVPSSCQLLSLAGLNNAQTFRRCFEMRVQTELSDGEKMFGCFPQMKLVWFWKCKMTPKIHIHTQIWNNFTASVCQWLVPCKFPCGRIHTHVWPDLPELTGSIFGSASLSGGHQRSSRNFHRSSLFSLSSADIWTLEQLSV